MKPARGLGRGLSALFSDTEEDYLQSGQTEETPAGGATEIDISLVFPNPTQPRKAFDENALRELADSISRHGIVQPIVVNRSDDRFMIIAGERRWRAAKLAGLAKVPCIVKEYTERQIKEIALIENLQREDLNPVEAAQAMRQLMDDYGLTQDELADRLGKSRSTVANALRLLTLSQDVIKLLIADKLTAGHARALVTLPQTAQYAIALQAVDNKWSVREVEQKVRDYFNPPEEKKLARKERQRQELSADLRDLVSRMQRGLGTKVAAIGNDRKGRIYIDYYTPDDLDRISQLLELIESKQAEEER